MNASCIGVIYCAASVVAVALGGNLVAHVSLATQLVKTLRIFFDGFLPFYRFLVIKKLGVIGSNSRKRHHIAIIDLLTPFF
jgi:hypothetical protein